MKETDRLLTTVQAAGYIGVSIQTLNKGRINGGDFPPFVKIGRNVRYRESSLIAWVEQHDEFYTVAQAKAARG